MISEKMSERKPLTATERKARFKQNRPESESVQKEKERQRDGIIRFHIKRNFLYGIEYPASVDKESEAFRRVYARVIEDAGQTVEVEYD